jgi:hypothetical protein
MNLTLPSYSQGFARSAGESENPGLWDGLCCAYVPQLGYRGATWQDEASNETWTLNSFTLGTHWTTQNGVLSLSHDSSRYASMPGRKLPSGNLPRSVFAKVFLTGANNYGNIFHYGTNAPQQSCAFTLDVSGRYPLVARYFLNATASTIALPLSAWATCGFTYDGQYLQYWGDGKSGGRIDLGAGWFATNTPGTGLFIGRGDDWGASNFPGSIACVYAWDRDISAAAIEQLSADPLAMFQPRRRAFAVAAAATTFKPARARNCNHLIGAGI